MTIGYDNEAQCCVKNADLESGHWYLDEDRQLFIVPDNGKSKATTTRPSMR